MTVPTIGEPPTGKAFLLSEESSLAWRVTSGAVDLFLVRTETLPSRDRQGAVTGARKPITRLESGSILLAAPLSPTGYALLAQPTPGTQIVDIQAVGGDPASLAAWIDTMSKACGQVQAEGERLTEGQQLDVPQGKPIYAGSPHLLWTRHTSGSSTWLGLAHTDAVMGIFPITQESWLVAGPACQLQIVKPSEAQQEDGIKQFQARLLQALERRAIDEDERRFAQLRARAGADQSLAAVAQRSLARALDDGIPTDAPTRQVTTNDALLESARAVGKALQLEIQAGGGIAQSKDPIDNIARASALRARAVSLEPDWWTRDAGPLVGYLAANNQAVALLPVSAATYELWDPVAGTRRRVNSTLAAQLAPKAHCFYRPFPDHKLDLKGLLAFGARGLSKDFSTVAIAGVLTGLLGLLIPIATGALVDDVIPSADRLQLGQMFLLLAASAVSGWLLQLLRSLAVLRIEGRMDGALQSAFWDRLLRLPVAFHRGYTAGDLATRGLGISAIRQTLTGTTLTALLSGLFSFFGFGLMFYYSPALALPAAGLVMLSFVVTIVAALVQIRLQRTISEESGKLAGMLPQLLTGISKLRVAVAEDRAFARWAARFAAQKRLTARGRRVSMFLEIFFTLFQTGTTMAMYAALIYVSTSGSSSSMSTGAFLAFQSAFLQVLGGASHIGSAFIAILAVVPLYERARPILQAAPEVTPGRTHPGDLSGDVELNQVAFRYQPGMPPVLTNVSMRIRAGQFVAIVGTTGSGKSTLMRLLLGFETPESGSVFYDGQDLAGLDLQAVRRQIGVVLQQGGVLGGDLFSNIVGSAPLTMDDAWEAARQAGLDTDIRAMPMGMHTVIPDGGLGLSGGQRQRLQIARAVVNRPRLIFFDEATSALDNQTQATVMESLNRLKATRIVIAHRLSTIRNADCIFVVHQGVIEESGTFEELMARGGLFESMARRQMA